MITSSDIINRMGYNSQIQLTATNHPGPSSLLGYPSNTSLNHHSSVCQCSLPAVLAIRLAFVIALASAKRHVSVTSRPARQAVGRNSDNLTTRRRPFVGRRATRRGGEPHVGRKAERRTESCTSDRELHVGRSAARRTESCTLDG